MTIANLTISVISMTICRYTNEYQSVWDAFVRDSRNGTFLFERAYMDYHADRFADHSLIFFNEKKQPVALLPANEHEHCLYSHQGLTYGGFIIGTQATAVTVMELFDALTDYARIQHMQAIYYKTMPSIYQLCPSEEDEYALWRHGAELVQVLMSTSVPLKGLLQPELERRRRRGLVKAQELGYTVQSEARLSEFWPIMEQNLRQRYDAAPVHTLQEMQLLQQRFPRRIRCLLVRNRQGDAIAGAVVYEANKKAVHVQYGHATEEGKRNGALDLLYLSLIDYYRNETAAEYFDFGTSNEQNGRYLNENLVAQKVGFGGRGISYKFWKLLLL